MSPTKQNIQQVERRIDKMASSALEAKINKIRQQNEEIRRRYEEVEEDKKNAAKLNALVQMVPTTDWPERKEPPEFSNPPRAKQKMGKEKPEYVPQVHVGEGKKSHTFAQGEGPPPDPKYNFLADAEREETAGEHTRENTGNRTYNKLSRGNFRKKNVGRETAQKDNKFYKGNYRDEYQPGYDAWRAERNRIDEDRISRQRTAEGNWRREWDNDKMHIVDDAMKTSSRSTLGDFAKKEHKDFDRKYHVNGSEHTGHIRGSQRPHRGTSKSFHNYENRSHNSYDQHRHSLPMSAGKAPLSPAIVDERTVIATDKSIKVTLNQGNLAKGPVMSVKVNSPSIAGTGRVGPRQRTRVTYSHSDAEVTVPETEGFSRQKSFEDKSKGAYFNSQKSPNVKRSHSQKKERPGSKSPYLQRREVTKVDENTNSQKYYENDFKPNYSQSRDSQKTYSTSKSPRAVKKLVKPSSHDINVPYSDKKESDRVIIDSTEDTNTKENLVDAQNMQSEGFSDVGPPKVESNDSKANEYSPEAPEPTLPEPKTCNVVENVEAPTSSLPDPETCNVNENVEAVEPSLPEPETCNVVENVEAPTSLSEPETCNVNENVEAPEPSLPEPKTCNVVENFEAPKSPLPEPETCNVVENVGARNSPLPEPETCKVNENVEAPELSLPEPETCNVVENVQAPKSSLPEPEKCNVAENVEASESSLPEPEKCNVAENVEAPESSLPEPEKCNVAENVGGPVKNETEVLVKQDVSVQDVATEDTPEVTDLATERAESRDTNLSAESSEVIAKDDAHEKTNANNPEAPDSSDVTLKTSMEDVPQNPDSSDTSVEQIVDPNESNKVTNDINKVENEAPSENVEQSESHLQPSELRIIEDCDSIKDEAADVGPAFGSEVETRTVIEADENVDSKRTASEDDGIEKLPTNEQSERAKNTDDVESCEANSEDTVNRSVASDGGSLEYKVEPRSEDVREKEDEKVDKVEGTRE